MVADDSGWEVGELGRTVEVIVLPGAVLTGLSLRAIERYDRQPSTSRSRTAACCGSIATNLIADSANLMRQP